MTIYFTYHLYHIPSGKNYYGVRYASGCNPSTLWTTYFSSSKLVHALIKEYGKDSFIATVRKTFFLKEKAIEWEAKFLQKIDAANSPLWINQSNGDKNFRGAMNCSKETRRKMSKARLGKNHTEETKQKIRESHKNRPTITEGTREKMRIANKGRGLGRTLSPETRQKIGDSKKGKTRSPMSEEQKQKIRKTLYEKGYRHSEEVRQRISNSKKGKPRKIQYTN